jgi:hypothetical protein
MFNAAAFSQNLSPFSQEFKTRLNEMAAVVATMQAQQADMARLMRTQDAPDFVAKITGATINTSIPIWTYNWTEVEPANSIGTNTDYQTKTGGRTGTNNAVNLLELGNTAGSAYGFAVALVGGAWKLTAAGFTNFTFHPVPANTIVRMRTVYRATSGTQRYEFSAPNRLDGIC